MARFTAYVETSSIGSRIERPFDVPDEELADCQNEYERGELIDSYAQLAIENVYEWGWEESRS